MAAHYHGNGLEFVYKYIYIALRYCIQADAMADACTTIPQLASAISKPEDANCW